MARAPASAGRLFEAALRILPTGAPVEQRAALLDRSPRRARRRGGSRPPTRRCANELELTLEGAARRRGCALITVMASMENLIGRNAQAHARLQQALEDAAR